VRVFDLTSRQPPPEIDPNAVLGILAEPKQADAPRLIYTASRDRVYALEFEPTK
jgi:hypothetical protein